MKTTLRKIVKDILSINQYARDDDFILVLEVYRKMRFLAPTMAMEDVFERHKELRLPSFESITRCRRNLQKECPELRASESARKIRKEEEMAYREEYSK